MLYLKIDSNFKCELLSINGGRINKEKVNYI